MSIIHTLLGSQPPARSDGKPWTEVRIEHSEDGQDPCAEDETQALTPVDADPSEPQTRDLTFESNSSTAFFRLVFLDGDGNESSPTDPVLDDVCG